MPSILPHPKNSQKAADVIIKNLMTSITFFFFLFKDVEKKNGAKELQTPHP